jgi:hypothetical protein
VLYVKHMSLSFSYHGIQFVFLNSRLLAVSWRIIKIIFNILTDLVTTDEAKDARSQKCSTFILYVCISFDQTTFTCKEKGCIK